MELKKIQECAEKFNYDLEALNKEQKRIASRKCLLLKQKHKPGYDEQMTELLAYYQVLVEAKNLVSPKKKTCIDLTSEDIEKLDFDETMKAIKAIQSKKTNSAWLTETYGDNDVYKKALDIENMLLEHKQNVKPVEDAYIRKSELQLVIDTIESSGKVSQAKILEMLKELL